MTFSSLVLEALQRGVASHRAGRLDDAEKEYLSVLKHDARNADALNLLGVIAQARGSKEKAIDYYGQAIASAPGLASAYFNRGNLLSEMGRASEAETDFRRALQINPDHTDAKLNLGAVLHKSGKLGAAAEMFREMNRLAPSDARGYFNLGRCLADAGDVEGAQSALQKALNFAPRMAEALVALAALYHKTGKFTLAVDTLKHAIDVDVAKGEYHSMLGAWLAQSGEWDAAAVAHQAACRLAPKRAEFVFNFAHLFYSRGQFDKAEQFFRQAIELAPGYADAYVNLGQVLADMGRDSEAMAVFDQALAIDPTKVEASENKAAALTNKALTLLAAGRFTEGWKIYRRRLDHRTTRGGRRNFDLPEWDGAPIPNDTLLLWTDQGLGDEIMYASMIPEAAALAGDCIIECEPRLTSLFRRSFAPVTVVPRLTPPSGDIALRKPSFHSSVADMGGYFRSRTSSFPRHNGYLVADASMKEDFVNHYRAMAAGRRIVGVSWRSDSAAFGSFKSLPLVHWSSILKAGNAMFVSLQYGSCEGDIVELKSETGIEIFHDASVDPMTDLDRFAAQVAAMDLVVSVSNTTVHFAGAMNVPVWTLVPSGKGALWYFRNGSTSLWYPSMRLYRQHQPGDWSHVVTQAAKELAAWLKRNN